MRKLIALLLTAGVMVGTPTSALRIACTEAALNTEIARVNACGVDYTGNCSIANRKITFNCTDTTILIKDDDISNRTCSVSTWYCVCGGTPLDQDRCASDSDCTGGEPTCEWNDHMCHPGTEPSAGFCNDGNWRDRRTVEVDDVEIDGENRNIVFALDPPCNDRVGTGVTETEQGAPFVEFDADNGAIRNLELNDFWQNYHAVGADVDNFEATNIKTTFACDDAPRIATGTGTGNLIDGYEIIGHKDKVFSMLGGHSGGSLPSNPNWTLRNMTLDIDAAGAQIFSIQSGTALIELSSFDGGQHSNITGGEVWIDRSIFTGMKRGIGITGSASVKVTNSRFEGMDNVGIAVCQTSSLDAECNEFINNGASGSSISFSSGNCAAGHRGGISKESGATVDAGNGSLTSVGNNTFRTNQALDIYLFSGSASAEDNCWTGTAGLCDDTTPDVSSGVDADPRLSSAPVCLTPGPTEDEDDLIITKVRQLQRRAIVP